MKCIDEQAHMFAGGPQCSLSLTDQVTNVYYLLLTSTKVLPTSRQHVPSGLNCNPVGETPQTTVHHISHEGTERSTLALLISYHFM